MNHKIIFFIISMLFLLSGKNADAKCDINPPPLPVNPVFSSVSHNSVILSAENVSSGCNNPSITERGFEYGTSDSYGSTKSETGAFTFGTFSLNVDGLECNTLYHFRSFATDSNAISGYSSDTSFTTSACPVVEKKKRVVSGSSAAAIASFLKEQEVLKQQIAKEENKNNFVDSLNGQVLRLGLFSDLVKDLQVYLNNHGFVIAKSGPGSPGNETRYFGLKTKKALMLFQKANGLFEDGVLGPKTLEFIK